MDVPRNGIEVGDGRHGEDGRGFGGGGGAHGLVDGKRGGHGEEEFENVYGRNGGAD